MATSGDGRQLPLDLRWQPAFSAEDFLVAPCNRDAYAWIERWPDWKATGVALWGPAGCGKSHLVKIWQRRADAVCVSAADVATLDARRQHARWHAVAFDGVDAALDDPGRAAAALHTFNDVVGRNGHVLLAGRLPPARWPLGLADLRSRLNTLPVVEISAPDDELLAALLVKQFADRRLRVGEGEIAYLLPRIERSFASVRRVVNAIDRATMAEHRAVTIPLIGKVLATTGADIDEQAGG